MATHTTLGLELPARKLKDHVQRSQRLERPRFVRYYAGSLLIASGVAGMAIGAGLFIAGFLPLLATFVTSSPRLSSKLPQMLAFTGAGLGLLLLGWALHHAGSHARLQPLSGAQPPPPTDDHRWGEPTVTRAARQRRDFSRRALSPLQVAIAVAGVFALTFGLAAAPFVTLAAGGATIGLLAFRQFRRQGFGTTTVTFLDPPYRVGADALLRFRTESRGGLFRSLKFTLRCVRERRDRWRDPVRHEEIFAHVIELEPPHEIPEPESDVEVTFPVPADAPSTWLSRPYPTYWELRVEGDAPGGHYDEAFLVPVYGPSAAEQDP